MVPGKLIMNARPYSAVIKILSSFMMLACLTGCGRDAALDEYREQMDAYYDQLSVIDAGINSIDPATDMDGSQLLGFLDELDAATMEMAGLEVPSQFASVESLADEASENMTQAVALYHQLYETDEYNEDLAAGAYEYYERANLRIRYVTDILHGDIPEELMVEEEEEANEQ